MLLTEIKYMSATQDILGAVLSLREEEQFLLVEQLLDRLSPESDGLADDDLTAELERRKADFEQGTAGEIPWSMLREEH
jgi:putative addiction module component (TIGR02574 family)